MGLVGLLSLVAGIIGALFTHGGGGQWSGGWGSGGGGGGRASDDCAKFWIVLLLILGVCKVLYSTYHVVLMLTETVLSKAEYLVENIQA